MAMRRLKSAGVIAVLAGCGPAPPATSTASAGLVTLDGRTTSTRIRCPDGSTDCTQTNGTAVYTAEGGYAGINTGEAQLMITHFINHAAAAGTPPSVTFEGRYYDPKSPLWLSEPLPQPGIVTSASYSGGQGLLVASVTESDTIPTWTLLDPSTQPPTPIAVTGPALQQLELHIRFADRPSSPGTVDIALAFDAGTGVPANRPAQQQQYAMTWRKLPRAPAEPSDPAAARPYCFQDAVKRQHVDPVVFQQGIDVDPVNGRVARSSAAADIVTLSCALGAPATVHRWGYSYKAAGINPGKPPRPSISRVHPGPTFYFDAGIQMKRASYCADETYHTIAGTHIEIDDDWPVLQNRPANVEAFWTPAGATCVNYVRVPIMRFLGECRGQKLPTCPPLPPAFTPPMREIRRGPDAYLANGLP
jgi:hypothetical protein